MFYKVGFHSVETASGKTTVITGDKACRVVIHHSPLLIDVYNVHNELVVQFNKNGKLKVEEFRQKEEGKEYPEGFWEETFKSFRDSKPFGSSSVGVRILPNFLTI